MGKISPTLPAVFIRRSSLAMLPFIIGSSLRMLALEKKALIVLRRLRCRPWSTVATMEFWAKGGKGSVDIRL